MSVKEFFAIGFIKQKVTDFLKNKADFESIGKRHKKTFRALITKKDNDYYVCDNFN